MAPRQNYYLHNTSRFSRKREVRQHLTGPQRSQLNLKIGGVLVVRRGRPLPVAENIIRKFLPQMIDLERHGLLEVYDYRSRRVDLRSLIPPEPVIEETPVEETPTEETPTDEMLLAAQQAAEEIVVEQDERPLPGPPEVPSFTEPTSEEVVEEAAPTREEPSTSYGSRRHRKKRGRG